MAFDYYVLVDDDDRDRVVGLFAVNRDKEAGRLDTMLYDHHARAWTSDPSAVSMLLFGEDFAEVRRRVHRSEAEQAAAGLGIAVPTEEELMRISDEAEQRRARRRRWRLNFGRREAP
ncbi:MAG: hypothetical protein KY431_10025 [Actinobacteria bacterium]|nr:hypothetical protein [Actinomycetota bacterium]